MEDIYRARYKRIPHKGASVLWSRSRSFAWHMGVSTNPEALQTPHLGFLWNLYHKDMIHHEHNLQPPYFFWRIVVERNISSF